jgi:hypothetical protein
MGSENSEFAYIEWLRRQTPEDPRVTVGPGDDAAVLRLAADRAPGGGGGERRFAP